MNERIKELAEQAWTMVSDEERARNQLYEADIQRERRDQVFAELIVRECLDISYRESHLPNAVLFDERSDKFIKDIHNRVDRATREHFGVEE